MRFKSRFHVKSGVADLWDYIREPRPYRWSLLFVSALIPVGALLALSQESHFRPPDAPKVTYISTFAEGRTDEEIRQSNLENQRRKEQLEAERAELRERKVDAYKTLGRATGLDVDTMAREAEIENAREAAKAEARQRELYQAGQAIAD
ncbi:hypothetical protein P8Q88_01195 [Qipengyuania sp. XHP0207]|uniref:hypothetical protein n=1 Tax=Qipengyuania sp. XHP0207 TaxID=3038078 RepID=UPI00241F2943|nr:hypothetical protein [Qipengyuania sp. XHP0207]MDG5746785.1 hypothetical protein [Qipengyuania sp. XHP0207]